MSEETVDAPASEHADEGAAGSPVTDDVVRVGRGGLIARLAASLIALALLLGGTFFGSDSDFPFGPFRMYATRAEPDGIVKSLRLEGVDAHGTTFVISAGQVGLRRAELEGSLPRMKADPDLMAEIAQRYATNNPDAAELAELHVVVRIKQLKDGKETGEFEDQIEAVWVKP